MNKQIQLLEKQAFDEVWDLDNDPIGPGTQFVPLGFKEKFAELIVLETLAQVNQNMELTWIDGEAKIKQHFGVES